MKIYTLCLIIAISAMLAGCSFRGGSPIDPPTKDAPPVNISQESLGTSVEVLTSGTMNLETGGIEFHTRNLSPYWNITSLIAPYFSYQITGYNPPIVNVKLKLTNPSTITGYDVAIVFENLYGKTVMNADGYIDIFGPYDIDPLIYFRKGYPYDQVFPPATTDYQILNLYYPGGSPLVDFFIIAHIGGHTGGVVNYQSKYFTGRLFPDGGKAILGVNLNDYQMDATFVAADTRVLTGGYTFFTNVAYNHWNAQITNSQNAPAGLYTITIMATSPSDPSYNTYDYIDVQVYQPGTDPTYFQEPNFNITENTGTLNPYTFSSGQHNIFIEGEDAFLTFWAESTTEGAVYFSRSKNKGTSWSNAKAITSEANGAKEINPSLASYKDHILIAYQSNYGGNNNIRLMRSTNQGTNWDEYVVTSSPIEEITPSVCIVPQPTGYFAIVAYIDNTNELLKVAIARSTNLDDWTHYQVSDNTWDIMPQTPSIAYNLVTKVLMVAWSDLADGVSGRKVYFDKSINGKVWGIDTPISDNWTTNILEVNPSLAINPLNGIAGVCYRRGTPGNRTTIQFVRASDSYATSFLPAKNISTIYLEGYNDNPSLTCDSSGRWLASFSYYFQFATNAECWFNESIDDGITWNMLNILNDAYRPGVKYPTISSSGSDVCVAWTDYRNSIGEIWVAHGTHR